MKTAMTELIEKLKGKGGGMEIYLNANTETIEKYLEKERKQHETTFHRGINIGAFNPELDVEGRKEAAKHYYESTFIHLNNQNK